ncbi:flagellar basal body rod modification protein FlgD [Cellulomonas chitinilytica]|uniref:Flagellar basal body rod modification protein FlgD n=1 Tax=Cellulomonas chitinilytica TaxID=398759 RepID=A0A919P7C0_9CELL|nr:flagellar hook capping FlgD N-terminal domain-containing protein [Cellulomonas chitinilytica]GIG22624.1 flagellar basal body rod modification protein FlgD [Cellulomonas chitinilytica]
MSIDVSFLGATSAAGATGSSGKASNELDKQAFLDLLVAQMRNQDPSSPMDSSQLMQQTTQLSVMESLQELTSTQREAFALQMRMNAAQLVGQQVTWTDADGATQTGVVSAVSYAGSVPTVKVGDQDVTLDAVASVTTAPTL